MPLLSSVEAFITHFNQMLGDQAPDWQNLSIHDYRESGAIFQTFALPLTEQDDKAEQVLKVDADRVSLKVSVFDSKGTQEDVKPVFIYIPGSGFVNYLTDCHDSACAIIARTAKCRVIMIHPRLAPEYPAPIPVQDVCAAVKSILECSDHWRIDRGRVALGGDSSGANLALCAALQLHNQDASLANTIKQLVLISGCFDLSMKIKAQYAWCDPYEKEDILTPEVINYMFRLYANDTPTDDPSISPYWQDLAHISPVLLLVAEYDGVRHQTEALYDKLRRLNVKVEKRVLAGQIHSYIAARKAMGQGEDPAMTAGLHLRSIFF